MNNYKRKTRTTSKGYRLQPATHKLIIRIQNRMQWTQEEVINNACKKFYDEIKAGLAK